MEYFNFRVILLLAVYTSFCCASSVILVEDAKACFRRVLAGKRVIRAFVKKAVPCERVEDCQRECSDEKRFVCEGYNYRLDPTGRGQGDCELLDLPLSRLNIRRDVYDDPDYDYYERDRNNDAPDCKGHRFYGSYGNSDSNYYHAEGRYDYYDHHRHGGYYDDPYRGSSYDHDYRLRPEGYDDGYRRYDNNRRGGKKYDHHHDYQDDYDKSYGYHYKYHHSGDEHSSHGYEYDPPPPEDYEYKPHYPPPPYDYKSYEPYLPLDYWDRERDEHWKKYFEDRLKDKQYWGFRNGYYNGWGSYGGAYGNFGAPDSYYSYKHHDDRYKNSNRYDYDYDDKKYFYVPRDNSDSKDWGRYGGTYGYGGQRWAYNNHRDSYDYWGFNRLGAGGNRETGLLPPYRKKPELDGNYLPPYDDRYDHYGTHHHDDGHHYYHGHTDVYFGRDYDDFLRDECSLRMVTGFRLHKGIVKKLIGVPNIYECELLCYRERDFPCNSYAFKYTTSPNSASENCYLSDRDYKELDYYTDLEPDRDCDIYTMNNRDKCGQTTALERYNSDCFWRVRNGQRLDQRVVRDSLNVKSIVDCQLECLRSHAFTCRAFSFRYGSPIIGGAIDNCQLTDLPFLELDPRIHLVPEIGFELYERGSYGHGCEPNHFHIGSKPVHTAAEKLDQFCYIAYGTPARLLPQATKKSIRVDTEGECKAECSRAREKSLFQCMSLSFQTLAPKGSPNCDLSDIVQRDLLSNVDYIADPDSWLFAWDIHNPRCASVISVGIGGGGGGIGGAGGGIGGGSNVIGGGSTDEYPHQEKGTLIPWFSPGYTWKIYSVGGLPCKRGSLCQENKVAGFWYCELEGKEEHAWDYCCRPDHQCGYSEGFPYQWCYVGPGRAQWRKCNDRYYPYTSNDRFDQPHHHSGSYLPEPGYPSGPAWSSSNVIGTNHVSDIKPPIRPGLRPDRPPERPPPTLEDYEYPHDNHFLDPPKPGGFGQSRHWPLSYLHKEMPPNDTSADPKFDFVKVPKGRNIDTKYEAIANLINVIKSNEPKSVQYQTANKSENSDDILYVQIPLPTNFSMDFKSEKLTKEESGLADKLEAVDLLNSNENRNSSNISNKSNSQSFRNGKISNSNGSGRRSPVYTRSYITKTNRTAINNQRRARGSI